jgi:hypothetical protein
LRRAGKRKRCQRPVRFQWQIGYELAEPIALPKGTRLRFITHFDNSPGNRFNPDPSKRIVFGPQNWDEMSNCFIGVLFDRDVNVAKAFMRSGPSLLPRGDFGPTLAVADLAPAAPVPASNGRRDTLQDR